MVVESRSRLSKPRIPQDRTFHSVRPYTAKTATDNFRFQGGNDFPADLQIFLVGKQFEP
jgi:hypothetical protein